jgi:hypothetical protein
MALPFRSARSLEEEKEKEERGFRSGGSYSSRAPA